MTCEIEGCLGPIKARGMCSLHLDRFYKYGDPLHPVRNVRGHAPLCSVDGCGRKYARHGLCRRHADRAVAHGSPTIADEMIASQGGLCAICKRPPRGRGVEARLHLDHDHRTGAIRGALCGRCNKGIGFFADSPALLMAAVDYVIRWAAPVAEVA